VTPVLLEASSPMLVALLASCALVVLASAAALVWMFVKRR
jgi:hypothetical protein